MTGSAANEFVSSSHKILWHARWLNDGSRIILCETLSSTRRTVIPSPPFSSLSKIVDSTSVGNLAPFSQPAFNIRFTIVKLNVYDRVTFLGVFLLFAIGKLQFYKFLECFGLISVAVETRNRQWLDMFTKWYFELKYLEFSVQLFHCEE